MVSVKSSGYQPILTGSMTDVTKGTTTSTLKCDYTFPDIGLAGLPRKIIWHRVKPVFQADDHAVDHVILTLENGVYSGKGTHHELYRDQPYIYTETVAAATSGYPRFEASVISGKLNIKLYDVSGSVIGTTSFNFDKYHEYIIVP